MLTEQRKKTLLSDLNETIKLYKQIKNHDIPAGNKYFNYHMFYENTNEHLSYLLSQFEIPSDSRILTVLASGDQPFNFINKGITIIDTFDINKLTEYYALGFKRTALEVLNYEQYLKLFYSSDQKSKNDLEKAVITCMPEDYKLFWTEYKYILRGLGYDASIFDLSLTKIREEGMRDTNNYLKNENIYKEFKQKLQKSKINFTHANITELPSKFSQYNLVFLSNIFDYYDTDIYKDLESREALRKAIELTKKIYNNNLLSNGELIFSFFRFCYANEVIFNETIEGEKNTYRVPYSYPNCIGIEKGKGILKK